MQRTIVCSICSRKKSRVRELIPARERYLGSHIDIAAKAAGTENLPFFILSGKFGLLAAGEVVVNYDYLLINKDVARLANRVAKQLSRMGTREVRFYTKTRPAWQPYLAVMESAASQVGARLLITELPDDA